MHCVGVIPARYSSQRLPHKALLPIAGRPMIYWVYRNALLAGLDRVYIATDHPGICEAVEGFGGEALLTSEAHPSGTSRIAEAARKVEARFFINIQGDEPQMAPEVIRAVAAALENGAAPVASAMVRTEDVDAYRSPAVVKVVTDRKGRALFFSRSPIPCYRDTSFKYCFKHLGIYGYTREFLLGLSALDTGWLEDSEKLEQLRFLDYGVSIQMVEVSHDSVGVDTAEDLERVRREFERQGVGAQVGS